MRLRAALVSLAIAAGFAVAPTPIHAATITIDLVAGSDPRAAHLIVDRAKQLNPSVEFIVRTGSDEEIAQLRSLSPRVQAVHGQRELAVQMARYTLRRFGLNAAEAEAVAQGLRGRGGRPLPRSTFTRGGGATR